MAGGLQGGRSREDAKFTHTILLENYTTTNVTIHRPALLTYNCAHADTDSRDTRQNYCILLPFTIASDSRERQLLHASTDPTAWPLAKPLKDRRIVALNALEHCHHQLAIRLDVADALLELLRRGVVSRL